MLASHSSEAVAGQAAGHHADRLDKLDKLAESSTQAAARRLSTSNVDQPRRLSASNGNDKGKNRMHDDVQEEGLEAKSDSEVESLYDSDDESLHCAICLSVIDDRTVVQPCCHDAYCFVCILAWTEQSRRCPLCVANIELLVHNIRSEKDYQKHYLPPLLKSDSPPPERSLRELREGARRQLFNRPTHPRFKYAEWKARNRPAPMPDVDAEDLALEKRRYIYKYGLYVKHVATNRFTRFRDYSAQQVSATPELKQRLQKWLRRELAVFEGVDLTFLVDYCTNIASQLELRSESATRLLAEFIGEEQAEHFWHETYSFLRSPYKDIRQYDKAVQYDRPPCKTNEVGRESRTSTTVPRRRDRSASQSSVSEADSSVGTPASRRSSFRSARDSWRGDRPPPPSRLEGDSYIPSYSKLNKARNPPRKRADRRSSRGDGARRRDNGWHSSEVRPSEAEQNKPNRAVDPVDVIPDRPQQPEWDAEEEISLGESDHDSGNLVMPEEHVAPAHHAGHGSHMRQAALSIRGLAQAKPEIKGNQSVDGDGKEVDLIRDFGPDLLSRLSASSRHLAAHERQDEAANTRLSNPRATSSAGIQMKGRGFRRGVVNSEMHATLMARLDEEKSHSGTASPAPAETSGNSGTSERTEASLRDHVLDVLKQRRQQASRAIYTQPEGTAIKGDQSKTLPETQPTLERKASRLALLQSRLAAEKAAISPPAPDAPVSMAQVDVAPGENAAQRMAELKRRLAEQKSARLRAQG